MKMAKSYLFCISVVIVQSRVWSLFIVRCPQFCPDIYDPKCGSDNRTYPNLCELNKAACDKKIQLWARYDGKCDQPSSCPPKCKSLDIKPVCGSDGVTRPNRCIMAHDFCKSRGRIVMVKASPCDCPQGGSPMACRKNYCNSIRCHRQPTAKCFQASCGTCTVQFFNGTNQLSFSDCYITCPDPCRNATCPTHPQAQCRRSYRDTCKAEFYYPDPLRVIKDSECTCRDPCQYGFCRRHPRADCRRSAQNVCEPEFYYPNVFRKDREYAIKTCGTKREECNEACTREYFPMCGTDGQTHNNPCMMNAKKCLSGGEIGLKHKGAC